LENNESAKRNPELLNPLEFRKSFREDIRQAHDYILIKSFVWRHDEFGDSVAEDLIAAAGRGINVIVLKDRVGAIYEHGEPNGQSFFHADCGASDPFYVQGRLIANFYGHRTQNRKNGLSAGDFINQRNVRFMEGPLFDHSKVIVIDGKIAYVSGINFGDEHLIANQQWNDFSLRIEDKEACENLLRQMADKDGMPREDSRDASVDIKYIRAANDSAENPRDELVQFIANTREELVVFMAYLGDPAYTGALSELVRSGRRLKLITTPTPSINTGSNASVLQKLAVCAGDDADNLTFVLNPELSHGKAMVRDGEIVRAGSQNLTRTDHIAETVATVKDDAAAGKLLGVAQGLESNGESYSGRRLVERFGSLPLGLRVKAALEKCGIALQDAGTALIRSSIRESRDACRRIIREVLGD
jgi:cardiolipin synthase A/B